MGLCHHRHRRACPGNDYFFPPANDLETLTELRPAQQARQSFLQAKEHISAVLSGAELVLLSIDRENLVTFFDGSAAASRCLGQVTADGGLPSVGSRVVWPDDRLKRAVDTILAEEQVCPASVIDETLLTVLFYIAKCRASSRYG